MKELALKDGTKLSVFDSSSEREVVLKLKKEQDFEAVKGQVTSGNLEGATLDGEPLSGLAVSGSFMAKGDGGYLTAHFALAKRSQTEQRIADLEEMLADIMGGTE